MRLGSKRSADGDVAEILEYLAGVAGHGTAAKYAEAFDGAFDRLSTFPGIGPPRRALGPLARIWLVLPYVIIYDYGDDVVTVLRVRHVKRDITIDLISRR